MVDLNSFYNLNIYNTEGKYVGKVFEVVLNIKKGRISFFKTKALTEDTKNIGIRDVIKNSMRIVPEEEDVNPIQAEGIIDIPYELVTAVGDIMLVDQNKLNQYQANQQKLLNESAQKRPTPKQSAKTN